MKISKLSQRKPIKENLEFPPITKSSKIGDKLVGFHSYINWLIPNFSLGQSLKLSLLFFDQIIAEIDAKDSLERHLNYLHRENRISKTALNKLLKIIIPIQDFIPDFSLTNLMRSFKDEFLGHVSEYYINQEYINNGKPPPVCENTGLPNNLEDIRYWLTPAAFENWFSLSKQFNCFFIPNSYEEAILRDFINFLSSAPSDHNYDKTDFFRRVVTKLLPGVENLSLDDIIEFRQHEYFESFRIKTSRLVERVLSLREPKEIDELIKDEEQKDIEVLKKLFRPKTKHTLFRVVIGNIPVPFSPFNPMAVFDGIDTFRKDKKAAKEIGWIYLVDDFKKGYKYKFIND